MRPEHLDHCTNGDLGGGPLRGGHGLFGRGPRVCASTQRPAFVRSAVPRDNPDVPSIRDTLIFFAIGCVVLRFGLWMIRWRLQARSWRMVSGRLLSKDIVNVEMSGDVSYTAVARYQYMRTHGRSAQVRRPGGSRRGHAQMLYDSLPEVGHTIDVWFDPDQPHEAVLDPTLRWSTYGVAALGAIFVLGSLAPWIIRALR